MKKILILTLLSFCVSVYGQNVHYGTTYTFDSQQVDGLEEYVASSKILLQNGFRATAANGAYYRFRIGGDPSIVTPMTYGDDNEPNDRQLDYSLPVGTISGQATVSPVGSALYDIPILIPSGTNGVEPSVSISYNSQSMNGLLGKGWTLNSTSSISRAGQVKYIDNNITSVNCTFNDRYSLDGQRLVLSSGSEGQANSVYRTEIESFSEISVTDVQGNGPKGFIVKTKDGQILEYGCTEDSRLLGDGSLDNTVLVWYLNKTTDQNGNYIVYRYRNIDGECVLDRIEYTGNEDENLLPYNVIKFNYSIREDVGFAYFGGKKLNNTLIVKSIEVKCDFVTKMTYVFNYTYNGTASLLNEIVLNDENGNHYNSLIFDWEDTEDEFTFSFNETAIPRIDAMFTYSEGNVTFGPPLNGITTRWPGDFNGDGLTDILEYKEEDFHFIQSGVHHDLYGYAFRILINDNQDGFIPSDVFRGYKIGSVSGSNIAGYIYIGDIDNDGDDDFFAHNESENNTSYTHEFRAFEYSNNQIVEMSSYSFASIQSSEGYENFGPTQLVISDFDGDLENEYFAMNGQNTLSHIVGLPISGLYTMTNFEVASFQIINFNGNAKMDILLSSRNGVLFVYEYDESSNSFVQISDYSGASIESYYSRVSFLGDYNGDGLTDILCYTEDYNYHTYISNGVHFIDIGVPHAINHAPPFNKLRSPVTIGYNIPGDFNGDGLTDFVTIGSLPNSVENFYIAYNRGENTFQDFYLIKTDIIPFSIVVPYTREKTGPPVNSNDFDGDGKNDIYAHLVSGVQPQIGYLILSDPTDHVLLEGVIDGLNHKTSFEYQKTAGNPSFYSKTMVNSPTTKVLTPVTRLVSKVSVEAKPANFETTYKYYNLLINAQGKGMLGFAKLESTDLTSGMRMESCMSIAPVAEFPYISEQKVFLTHYTVDESDDELRATNMTEIMPSASCAYGFYPITISSVSIDHELQTRMETTIDPDDMDMYGNELRSTSKAYDLISQSANNLVQTKITQISYNYSFESSKHILGLPASMIETVTRTGSAAITSKKNFVYNAEGNVWKIIENPSFFISNKSVVTEMLGYNGCGMPTIKQVSAPNDPLHPPVRAESWEYDSKNRFVIAKTDAEGHTSYFSYNKVFGSVIKAVDIQGNVVTSEYDNFGNLLSSTDYLGQSTQYITDWNQNGSTDALYYSKVIAPNSPQSQTWFDKNGRAVLAKSEGLSGDVLSEKEYNVHGHVLRESLPHFSGEAPRYIEYSYYNDGRLHTKTYEGLSTQYTYNGRNTTVIKPDGKTEVVLVDALGLTYRNTDELGTVINTYNSTGQVVNIQSGLNNTQFEYDPVYNWRTKTISPDLGEIVFAYYATGELYRQTDALGNQLEYTYDNMGRVSEVKKFHAKTSTTETITYSYNSTGNGVGQINTVLSSTGIEQNYSYDTYGRLIVSSENIQGKLYESSIEYNDKGQVLSQIYPYGYEIENEYNSKGFLTKMKQAADGQMIWQAVADNSIGQRTQSMLGNGVALNMAYDPIYNTLESVQYSKQNVAVWQQQYSFNEANGNLDWRTDAIRGFTESFDYGLGDRLEVAEINNGLQLNMNTISYVTNGNIAEKSDVGSYSYGGAQPHAVTEVNPYIGTEVLANQIVHYNATNKAYRIEQDEMVSTLIYGPDDQRRKMVFPEGTNTSITRYYQPGFEEDEFSDGRNKKTYYISTPDGLTAMKIVNTTAGQTDVNLYYVASDFLGSICGLMDATGAMQEEYSFDAWGKRRNPTDWLQTDTRTTFITDRGYTGHEMLDMYGLINMNGRMYDPQVGRFLSADPVVQTAGGSQAYNAYSYALNNPLKDSDPSGYMVSGGNNAPDINGVNSRLQWSNYNYYNDLYARQEYSLSGGINLSRFAWGGGGVSAVWDGANGDNTTMFISDPQIIKQGGTWVQVMSESQKFYKNFSAGKCIKFSIGDIARGFINGTLGYTNGYGWSTTELLNKHGDPYISYEQLINFSENRGFSNLLNYAASSFSTAAGLRFTSSNFLRKGYWRAPSGNYWSADAVNRGWSFEKSMMNAKNTSKYFRWGGNVLGLVSTLISAKSFIEDPNILDGAETTIGVASIFLWEVGVIYYAGKGFFELTLENTKHLMENDINPGMQFIMNKE